MCKITYVGSFGSSGPVLVLKNISCIDLVRECYVRGEITSDRLEELLEHVLNGGHVDDDGIPIGTPQVFTLHHSGEYMTELAIMKEFGWKIPECWECEREMDFFSAEIKSSYDRIGAIIEFRCYNVFDHHDRRVNICVFDNSSLFDRIQTGWERETPYSIHECRWVWPLIT